MRMNDDDRQKRDFEWFWGGATAVGLLWLFVDNWTSIGSHLFTSGWFYIAAIAAAMLNLIRHHLVARRRSALRRSESIVVDRARWGDVWHNRTK